MKIVYFKKGCSSTCGETFVSLINTTLEDLSQKAEVIIKSGAEEAAEYGVPEVPSLMINDKIVALGFNLTQKQLTKAIKKAAQ